MAVYLLGIRQVLLTDTGVSAGNLPSVVVEMIVVYKSLPCLMAVVGEVILISSVLYLNGVFDQL